MEILCIYGAGGLGRDFLGFIQTLKMHMWDEIMFIDDVIQSKYIDGVKVFTFQEFIEKKDENKKYRFIIANGEPIYREKLYQKIVDYNLYMTKIFFNSSIVTSNAVVGEGSIVHCQSIVSVGSVIGENVLIGKNAMVGHDVIIGNHSVISACSYVGGMVTIGTGCYIGANATIRDKVTIGKNCIIGMGSVVTKSVPDSTVMAGNPAKFLRKNEKGIIFDKDKK